MEFLHNFTCLSIVCLGTTGVITAACHYDRMSGDEANRVYDWVDDVASWCHAPGEALDWSIQATEVPSLDSFSESTSASDHVIVAWRNIDTVPTNLGFTSNRVSHFIHSDVPEANLSIPASWEDHIWRLYVEPARENFVCMCRVDFVTKLLDFFHTLFVIDLYVGLRPRNHKSASISGIVDRVILLFIVEHYVLDCVAHLRGPA